MKIEVKTKFNISGGTASQIKRQPAREQKPQKKSAAKRRAPEPQHELPPEKKPRVTMPKITLPHIALPKIRVPHFKVPRFRFRGKRLAFLALLPLAALGLVMAVWLGMNLWKDAVPKPLFTETSLQAVPPADSNGCVLLYDDQLYGEFSNKDLNDVNMFRNAATIEVFLDKARDEYTFAKTIAGRDDVKKMMALHREIMARTEFADIVQPDARDARKISVYLALHNAITATVIANMQEKKYGAAFAMMRDQLSLNARYFTSARSMTNYLMSLRAYEKSLGIFKSMLAQSPADGTLGPTALAICREIGDMMRSFNPASVPLAPIVRFEYILSWKQTFNPGIQNPETQVRQGMKRKALVFFDRGLTQKWYDERWKKLYDLAKNPNDVDLNKINELQQHRYTSRRFWWFHNAVGKKYLDSLPLSIYQLYPESKNMTATVSQRQGEIITVIDALKEEVKQEKKPARQQKKPVKKKPVRKPAIG